MTTIVPASTPASFLSLVPHLLGCVPRRSLVLVPFAHGRSLGAMRVDLPPSSDPTACVSVASTVIGMACKVATADAVAVVVYADEPLAEAAASAHGPLVDATIARAEICGLRITEALIVGADGWDDHRAPSSTGPYPLPEIDESQAGLPDTRIDDDQYAAAELPGVDDDLKEVVAEAIDAMEHVLGTVAERRRLPLDRVAVSAATASLLAEPPLLFEDAISRAPSELTPRELAAVSFCLERPSLRDVALMQWAGDIRDGYAVLGAQTAYHAGAAFPEDLARPMWGEGAHPDPDRLHRALALCRLVAATVPPRRRPGSLSACAWLAWAVGRSTHAATYAEHALDIDSAHGLSGIMLSMIDGGRLPEWVFERPTSRAGTSPSRGFRDR